nr:immunoglobulin light chain junction region [Macaca mulatta]
CRVWGSSSDHVLF